MKITVGVRIVGVIMMVKMQMKNKMQIKIEVEARMNTRTIIEIENSEIVSLKCSRIYTQKTLHGLYAQCVQCILYVL